MEELFRLIRFPLIPIPLVLWSVAWPVLLLITYVIIVPIFLIVISIIRSLGLPFVFLYSALNNDVKSLKKYVKNWKKWYDETIKFVNFISIAEPYKIILDWLVNPKTSGGTGVVVTTNLLTLLVIASIYSEAVRTIVIGIVVAFIALIIWGNS